jgi:hypothetical protein
MGTTTFAVESCRIIGMSDQEPQPVAISILTVSEVSIPLQVVNFSLKSTPEGLHIEINLLASGLAGYEAIFR